MNVEDLNLEITNRANERVSDTLACFFNKLYKDLVEENQISLGSYTDILLRDYLSKLHLYVHKKIILHKLKRKVDLGDYAFSNLWAKIGLYYNEILAIRKEKNKVKNRLLEMGIEIPISHYPSNFCNLPFAKKLEHN